jgi:hypothetical protein
MKKTVLEWMMESGHDELPHPKVFTDIIMTRDFSKFAQKETDTEEEKDVKSVLPFKELCSSLICTQRGWWFALLDQSSTTPKSDISSP